jgi:hypothetical protein
MNQERPPHRWVEVPPEHFQSFITDCVFDYRREAWGDSVTYRRKSDGELFGIVFDDGKTFVHPALVGKNDATEDL